MITSDLIDILSEHSYDLERLCETIEECRLQSEKDKEKIGDLKDEVSSCNDKIEDLEEEIKDLKANETIS